ncbi:hypothetical protein JCM8202v2_002699 [Rhodotorula sphaerocarpa]
MMVEGEAAPAAMGASGPEIRLHLLFPLVPISDLRSVILDADPRAGVHVLWTGVEALLIRARHEEELRRRRRRGERTPSDSTRRGAGGALWNAFAGWIGLPQTAGSDLYGRSPRAEDAADPILTPHDLFRSAVYNAELVTHLEQLFPSAPPRIFSSSARRGEIERLVVREGGSYASLRQRLEARMLEAQASNAGGALDTPTGGGGGFARWWKKLIRVEPPPATEARTSSGAGTSATSDPGRSARPRSSRHGSRGPEVMNPFLQREIRAYEARRNAAVPAITETGATVSPTSRAPDALAAASTSASTAPETTDKFECQCCFVDEPALPSVQYRCDAPSDHRHSFCHDCVRSLAQNYAFGTTSWSDRSLEALSLPCMAAAAREPCAGVIPREELRRALPPRTWKALERRATEAVLERFCASAGLGRGAHSAQSTSSSKGRARLVRCPFCTYAELVDPLPGPIASTFYSAWVHEPFPPSLADVVRTLVGGFILLPFLSLLLAILVFVTPARRLERAYDRIQSPVSPSTAATASSENGTTSSLLTLPERILLEPHRLGALVLTHLGDVCERVRARRRGERTVFRCRNVVEGGMSGGRARARWEVVKRMEAVDAGVLSSAAEKEEEEDPFVEEIRRERIIQFVWGSRSTEDESSSSELEQGYGPVEGEDEAASGSCGRLSCLLCQAPLNPSAPSLHVCRSTGPQTSADSAEGGTEQERAEESLRLVVEKAMNAAVVRECGRCGAGLTKTGGEGACNKVTCRCGFAYCHACQRPITAWEGYAHYCPHPRDPADPSRCPEAGCNKCSLWLEPDLGARRAAAAERARETWAEEHPEWAEKVAQTKPLGAVGADSRVVPFVEATLDYFDALVEQVARLLLSPVQSA